MEIPATGEKEDMVPVRIEFLWEEMGKEVMAAKEVVNQVIGPAQWAIGKVFQIKFNFFPHFFKSRKMRIFQK